ncbi:MAG: hypothetical protein H0V82_09000 [Candidatus Protochlamydia sp.]|nr:hypothetical protein [Candidatus Protochlamydia sp.]
MYYPTYNTNYNPNFNQNYNSNQMPYPIQYQQMPSLTQAAHLDTLKLIDKMKEVVGSVLPAATPNTNFNLVANQRMETPTFAINPINLDFSRREYNLFSSKEIHHHHATPINHTTINEQQEQEKKNQANKNLLIGILGFGIMAATAYFLGKNDAQNEEAQQEEVSFESLKRKWSYNKNAYQAQGVNVSGIEDSINKVVGILNRKETERTHRTALLLLTFSAGALLAFGAIGGSALLIHSGLGIGAGTAIFALYKLGYAHFSNQNAKDAKIVENNLNTMRSSIQNLVLTH